MGDMKQSPDEIKWLGVGTRRVGVLVSDTMMFQRFGPDASDPDLGSFYGLVLPLLMRGMPVQPVQIETADLDDYRVLLLTYEGQKPTDPKFHDRLARWVRKGGTLIVIDDDRDPFHSVREWWNTGIMRYRTPRRHLFDTLEIERDRQGLTRFGDGFVVYLSASPAALSKQASGADRVRETVREGMDAAGINWEQSTALVMRRGPYVIGAGLERASRRETPFELRGKYISLFDAQLPTVTNPTIGPGERAFYVDISRTRRPVGVIAAACRVLEESISPRQIVIVTDGIEATTGVLCVKLPKAPNAVEINDQPIPRGEFQFNDGVLRVRFENQVKPNRIVITR
jgi:hypothetical protein